MLIRGKPRKFLKRLHRLVFYDTFELALRPVRVNTEPYFWLRELMIHLPGRVGYAYRGRFYGHFFKQRPGNIMISPGVCIEHPQGLSIGEGVTINRNVWLNAVGGLTIGSYCGIGPNTVIHTANHNFASTDVTIQEQQWTHREVVIEDDVWLGASVNVMPGVHIGRGAIVGAGTTVVDDIAPYAIVVGEKGRMIRSRKPSEWQTQTSVSQE
jgi:acetyltransferase-like isoleucine patch superfamily enzyme